MPRRLILTIDGGGIRGIIPACLLVKLEQATGKPARETFSFISGTSTGAIIAGGLAAGIPAQRILDIYMRRGEEIFPQSPLNILKRIAFGHAYSIEKLHTLLREEAGAAADWTLNDAHVNAGVDVMITAKRVTDGLPWYFVGDNDGNSKRTGRLNLIDCTTASAAAPTYFAPWTIRDLGAGPDDDPDLVLTDGGVGVAGNPVYQACVEAFAYTQPPYDPADTTVISLGTGRFADRTKTPTWIWPWFQWVLGELLDSAGEQQTELVKRHYPDAWLYRLDPDLKELDPSLTRKVGTDEVDRRDDLRTYGERFAAKIDWAAVLEGRDTTYRIGRGALPFQYQKA